MKKLTASLLLISLLASLASCGSQDSGTNDTTSSGASTDTTAEETTSQFVKDDLPSDLDLGGKTVGIMIGDYFNAFLADLYSPEETGNRLSDAVYRTSKNVQERLNVVLEYNYQTYAWSEMAGFQSKIISGILAGDTGFDILFDVQNYSAQMQEGEYFANFADVGNISLEKPWYNQTVLENMPDDYIYFLSGQFSLANVKSAFAMYFNADLYSSLGLTEDLYALVDDGKWTIDKLDELTKNTYSDLNGDTKADASDRYGVTFGDMNKYLGFIKAFDIDMFRKTSSGYEFAYDSERASDAVSKLCQFINDNENTQVAFGNDRRASGISDINRRRKLRVEDIHGRTRSVQLRSHRGRRDNRSVHRFFVWTAPLPEVGRDAGELRNNAPEKLLRPDSGDRGRQRRRGSGSRGALERILPHARP